MYKKHSKNNSMFWLRIQNAQESCVLRLQKPMSPPPQLRMLPLAYATQYEEQSVEFYWKLCQYTNITAVTVMARVTDHSLRLTEYRNHL